MDRFIELPCDTEPARPFIPSADWLTILAEAEKRGYILATMNPPKGVEFLSQYFYPRITHGAGSAGGFGYVSVSEQPRAYTITVYGTPVFSSREDIEIELSSSTTLKFGRNIKGPWTTDIGEFLATVQDKIRQEDADARSGAIAAEKQEQQLKQQAVDDLTDHYNNMKNFKA